MTQMQSLIAPRLALWLMLTLPAVWIRWRNAADMGYYGQVIHFTGDFSVPMLIVIMAATPLRLALPRAALPMWLMRRQRDFGNAVFGYAMLHLAIYPAAALTLLLQLDADDEAAMMWDDVGRLYFWIHEKNALAGDCSTKPLTRDKREAPTSNFTHRCTEYRITLGGAGCRLIDIGRGITPPPPASLWPLPENWLR